jgi:drug/metabolite transporter (DMT)-like permease
MAATGIREATGVSTPAGLTTAGLTAATMVAFASNSLLCRAALEGGHADAASFTLLRLGGGALALGLLARALRTPETSARTAWGSAVALFAYALAFSLAYRRVPAAVGALLLFAAVQLTMVLAGLRTGERPRAVEWVGHALSVGGVVVLTRPGLARADPVGAALMLLAGVAWGVYSLRGRGAGHPVARNAASFTRTLPLALVAASTWVALGAAHVDAAGAGLALASGALASGLGYALWYAALRGLTATRAALVQLSVPPLAAAGGVLLLREVVSARLLVSGALVLGGIALAVAGHARIVREMHGSFARPRELPSERSDGDR